MDKETLHEKIIDMLSYGTDIDDISYLYNYDCRLELKEIGMMAKTDATLRKKLAEALSERIGNGTNKTSIMEEVGYNNRFLSSIFAEFNLNPKKKFSKGRHETVDNYSKIIDWDKMDQCPNCKSTGRNVRDVSTIQTEESLCINCDTGWIKTEKKVREILWYKLEE